MKRLALALGILTSSFILATQARADFAVVQFNSGYCRVWTDTAAPPQDFQYLAFRRDWQGRRWWQHIFATLPGAEEALHEGFATSRCHH